MAGASGQSRRFRVMTYNVENLFDTCHDEGFDDYEFLPTSERHWNSYRYWAKQGRLAGAIAAVGGDSPADLVGLCEVENDSVMNDLCSRTRLKRLGYEYVMTRSMDYRGLDVALLYQPMRFALISATSHEVPFYKKYGRHTRDILHVAGRLQTGDTLDVFVCHFPSRRGGSPEAAKLRGIAARTLREVVDSVTASREKPAVIIMGDFNDEYSNRSISKHLGAVPVPRMPEAVDEKTLYVLSANLKGKNGIRGTYKYQGEWNQLDQIIVNGALLNGRASLHTSPGNCRIYAPGFLSQPDESQGGVKLKRTYQGPIYRGGYSDHFPLVADFWF